MNNIGKISTTLTADSKPFTKGMERARRDVETFSQSSKRSLSALNSSVSKLAGGFGALLGAGAIAGSISQLNRFTKETLNTTDTLGKISSKLGITGEQLQVFQYQAELAGVGANTFNTSFQRFTRRIEEVRQGTGVLKTSFEQLGIQIKDSDGKLKDNVTLYNEYMQVLSGVTDASTKLKHAVNAFDSEGGAMANIADKNAKSFEALKKELQSVDALISDDLIKSAAEYNDKLLLMQKRSDTVSAAIADSWAPVVHLFENLSYQTGKVFGGAAKSLTNPYDPTDIDMSNIEAVEDRISFLTAKIKDSEMMPFAFQKSLPKWRDELEKLDKVQSELAKKNWEESKGSPVSTPSNINVNTDALGDEAKAAKAAADLKLKQEKAGIQEIDNLRKASTEIKIGLIEDEFEQLKAKYQHEAQLENDRITKLIEGDSLTLEGKKALAEEHIEWLKAKEDEYYNVKREKELAITADINARKKALHEAALQETTRFEDEHNQRELARLDEITAKKKELANTAADGF